MKGTREALFRALSKRSAKSEDRAVNVRAGQLLKRMGGSVKEAAAKVGASPRTFKRWLDGQATPKAANSEALNRANRDVLAPQGRRERLLKSADDEHLGYDEASDSWGVHRPEGLGSPSGGFVVDATITVSQDTRRRTVNLGEYLSSGHMAELLDAYMSGNEAKAQGVLAEGFELWVPQAEVNAVHGISFGPLDYEG
ncbi:hypothetical protein ACN6LF_001368 [[Kitasatospora] papulosa]|uniref:hypothetical protein n=1 Tax=[Kitasatospora] papulosa TaxID=1464011 RepID=UPI00403D1CA5